MRLKFLCLGLVALLPISSSVFAEQVVPEGKALAELSFESVDEQGNGYLDLADMENMRKNVFTSMDADDSSSIALTEFLEWGFGFDNIAEDVNKTLSYRVALSVVFALWDRDRNGEISETEHRKAIIRDFRRADLNDDALLDKDEFIGGFSILLATRVALKP